MGRARTGLKNLEQATEIRRRILWAFEEAERSTNLDLRKYYLTFIVVGGGPTGMELAGAIGEMSRFTLTRDFGKHRLKARPRDPIESGQRILGAFSPSFPAAPPATWKHSACKSGQTAR